MKIKTLEVAGIGPAIFAMRNPMDSWEKSDSRHGRIGTADNALSEKLAKAGPAHAKHLRLIQVWAEMWAPRYWWQEFDTNRIGVEKVSCSTMHTLTKQTLTPADFEWSGSSRRLDEMIRELNELIDEYRQASQYGAPSDEELAFRELKQSLPECFIQRRTVMMSYQAVRNMYELREGHRLREWRYFRKWAETLPESQLITGKPKEEKDYEE